MLDDNPSLKPYLTEVLGKAYPRGLNSPLVKSTCLAALSLPSAPTAWPKCWVPIFFWRTQ
ncbi:hypothetical protein [Nodosilinea sp. FACHB-13]|uniref:hypothetical protein n=1 Tax=Cyanophyceae TaxID=3028117 RepID=UPI0032427ED9